MPRILVILPSWVGDAVMATPALRLIRSSLPGALVGGLVRPGIEQILAGLDLFDEVHIATGTGVMGPKFAAAKIRPRRYDAALLLPNSFSSALIARVAGIPRRIGYARDGRGILLTDRLEAPTRPDGSWAPIPAVEYYLHAARALLDPAAPRRADPAAQTRGTRLELSVTPDERRAGEELLRRAEIAPGTPFALLNPGGNNPAKRWPPERFAALADRLAAHHGLTVLVNGSPGEVDLAARIASIARTRPALLPRLGVTLAALKAILAARGDAGPRCRLMVTNDTGPRHIAAAFGVPLITLFGPTDHRWTTIPTPAGERILLADPTLPEGELANDHPERCRVDRITLEEVAAAADGMLEAPSGARRAGESSTA